MHGIEGGSRKNWGTASLPLLGRTSPQEETLALTGAERGPSHFGGSWFPTHWVSFQDG